MGCEASKVAVLEMIPEINCPVMIARQGIQLFGCFESGSNSGYL